MGYGFQPGNFHSRHKKSLFFSKTTNLSAFWSFIFLLGIRFFSAKFVVKCIFEIQSTIEGGIKILDFTTEIDVC